MIIWMHFIIFSKPNLFNSFARNLTRQNTPLSCNIQLSQLKTGPVEKQFCLIILILYKFPPDIFQTQLNLEWKQQEKGSAWTNVKDTNPLMSSSLLENMENMVHSTVQHPPPPTDTHCLYCIYCTFSLGRGGGGQREGRGARVYKYSSFVHGGNSSQARSKLPIISECISSL